jgi:hypothetical protein
MKYKQILNELDRYSDGVFSEMTPDQVDNKPHAYEDDLSQNAEQAIRLRNKMTEVIFSITQCRINEVEPLFKEMESLMNKIRELVSTESTPSLQYKGSYNASV